MAERDRLIKDLRGQIQTQSSALSEIRVAQANLESSLQRSETEKQQRSAAEQKSAEDRRNLDQKLQTAEATLQNAQEARFPAPATLVRSVAFREPGSANPGPARSAS